MKITRVQTQVQTQVQIDYNLYRSLIRQLLNIEVDPDSDFISNNETDEIASQLADLDGKYPQFEDLLAEGF